MIFKQNVLKEEIIYFLILVICVLTPYISIIVIGLIREENPKFMLFILSIMFIPLLILTILIGFKYLEWYCIYDDHIEVRNIYGKINSVFYNNVSSVEEVEIYLYRGTKKKFYIFNDGRKNNGNIFDFNFCYNNKKFNLRIYKTNELENYIINTLKFKVNGK